MRERPAFWQILRGTLYESEICVQRRNEDGAYAAFGCVTEGMDVVDEIATTKTDYTDRPLRQQKIAKMTVETFGVEYPAPKTL